MSLFNNIYFCVQSFRIGNPHQRIRARRLQLMIPVQSTLMGIKRTHSNTGPVSASTKQMGPGYCHDGLDWHWTHWNWQKFVGLGKRYCHFILFIVFTNLYRTGNLLYRKLTKALLEAKEHGQVFQRFTELQVDDVPDWLAMATAWEQDHTNPNPYIVIKPGQCTLPFY